ncbi:hypothetical protein B0T17DRAFT_364416 [Bombardia bombarda]|uniref:Uncharacterized protein n=1 Tax=Bombardia bombarda TaxID=252184 RepID=A0AA39WIJ2_9PEZI|nr:hypothetical protein B0T17DRAFT_364416 [Bombardia bombarda]
MGRGGLHCCSCTKTATLIVRGQASSSLILAPSVHIAHISCSRSVAPAPAGAIPSSLHGPLDAHKSNRTQPFQGPRAAARGRPSSPIVQLVPCHTHTSPFFQSTSLSPGNLHFRDTRRNTIRTPPAESSDPVASGNPIRRRSSLHSPAAPSYTGTVLDQISLPNKDQSVCPALHFPACILEGNRRLSARWKHSLLSTISIARLLSLSSRY